MTGHAKVLRKERFEIGHTPDEVENPVADRAEEMVVMVAARRLVPGAAINDGVVAMTMGLLWDN